MSVSFCLVLVFVFCAFSIMISVLYMLYSMFLTLVSLFLNVVLLLVFFPLNILFSTLFTVSTRFLWPYIFWLNIACVLSLYFPVFELFLKISLSNLCMFLFFLNHILYQLQYILVYIFVLLLNWVWLVVNHVLDLLLIVHIILVGI